MIARVLSRYADARLRTVLRRTLTARNDAREDARILRRRLAARDREVGTLRVLVATWQRIAREAQDQLAAERAHTQETTR